MNSYNLPSNWQIAKTNGKVFPWVRKIFTQLPHISYPESFLPWMIREQKITYVSSDIQYQYRANTVQNQLKVSAEIYYENKFYEMIIGSLLRHHLLKKNKNAIFYYASQHDDYIAWCDYIISQSGNINEFVRIDLTIGDRMIWKNEHDYTGSSVQGKMRKFHKDPGIPEEFFQSEIPGMSPMALPLIILRISRPILLDFANSFFKALALGKTEMNILEYFLYWMPLNNTQERVAYILWMNKKSAYRNDYVENLTTEIGGLFPGVSHLLIT